MAYTEREAGSSPAGSTITLHYIIENERWFARMQAYRKVLHWAALASLVPTPFLPWGWRLVCWSAFALLRAGWAWLVNATERRQEAMMARLTAKGIDNGA